MGSPGAEVSPQDSPEDPPKCFFLARKANFFGKRLAKREKILYLCRAFGEILHLLPLSWEYGFEWRTHSESVRDTNYLPAKHFISVFNF
jgi:hypothetical protein